VEETVYFRCFGGFAAKTTKKDSQLPCCRRRKTPVAARKTTQPRSGRIRLRQGEKTVYIRLMLRLCRNIKRKR
jgi:hypothetical protein